MWESRVRSLEDLRVNKAETFLLSAQSCRKDKQFKDYFPNNYITTTGSAFRGIC